MVLPRSLAARGPAGGVGGGGGGGGWSGGGVGEGGGGGGGGGWGQIDIVCSLCPRGIGNPTFQRQCFSEGITAYEYNVFFFSFFCVEDRFPW